MLLLALTALSLGQVPSEVAVPAPTGGPSASAEAVAPAMETAPGEEVAPAEVAAAEVAAAEVAPAEVAAAEVLAHPAFATGQGAAPVDVAAPVHVGSWRVRFTLDAAGDAQVDGVLTLGDTVPAALLVPLRPADGVGGLIALAGGAPVRAEVLRRGGVSYLSLDAEGLSAGQEVALRWEQRGFVGPKGLQEGEHHTLVGRLAFVNTSGLTFDQVEIAAVNPPGRLAHRVLETSPRLDPKSPEIPYAFLNRADEQRSEVTMRCQAVGPGERCAITWNTRPWSRSWIPWLLGGLLSLGWLGWFTHLLRPGRAG
ncbi:MAG: hypothetical protein JXX28_19030 [Deltaproteobacteria bacterium]|nr:hypothetical protein [Deltaproteobacteria bacterium]